MMAPEVDDYDIVPEKNILSGNLDIGEIVEYKIK
jgi:hypothetical protein